MHNMQAVKCEQYAASPETEAMKTTVSFPSKKH